jgi:hypothetical protein
MSPPTKELLRLVLAGSKGTPRYRHGGNPLVRWQVDNLVPATGPAPRLVKRVWWMVSRNPGITVGLVLTLAHRLQALGEGHGIAAVTSR